MAQQTNQPCAAPEDSEVAGDASVRCLYLLFTAAMAISLGAGLLAARNLLPWSDEGWFSSAAYNLAHHGFLGTTVMESQGTGLTRIAQRTYWAMPLYLVGEAFWYKLASSTILSTRAFSLFVWYPMSLASFWVFLAQLRLGRGVAPLAASLLATSFVFVSNAAFARPDMMCCALGLAGMAAYLTWRKTHFYRALFAANLLIAMSGLTHPNGIFHLLGLLVIALWLDRTRIDWRALAASALPYLILGAAWGLYISRDVKAFHDQMMANGTNGRWAATVNPIVILKGEVMRYLTAFGLVTRGFALAKIYALAAYAAAIAGCLLTPSLRACRGVRLLLTLLICYFAAMSVFNQKLSYYLVHIVPFYIAILAVWIVWIWDNAPRLRRIVVLAVAALVMVETSGIVLKAVTRSYRVPQQAALAFVRAHVKLHDRICGSAALIYGLDFDPRLRDDPYLGLKSGRLPEVVIIDSFYRLLYDAWATERPGDMQRIRQRLEMFRLAYLDGDYEVYLLPELSPAVVPPGAVSRIGASCGRCEAYVIPQTEGRCSLERARSGGGQRHLQVHCCVACSASFALQPHRTRSSQLSNDPFFPEKVRDVAGLCLNPPDHALALCVDEKSQIQAPNRTRPVLPMGLGYVERVSPTITFATGRRPCLPRWTSPPGLCSPSANPATGIRSSLHSCAGRPTPYRLTRTFT